MGAVLSDQLQKELESFQTLWEGGYFLGEPLDPMGYSDYRLLGYLSVLYATYLACIRPYVTKRSVVLEIGPGRGAWTKTFLHAKEVWCLDALPAEHNRFWDHLGHPANVQYFQVKDFSCRVLPENNFDYLFSFGCFCHISFEGISEYMKNLYPKLKSGAHGFVMVADYSKYNAALERMETFERAFPPNKRYLAARWTWKLLWKIARRSAFYRERKDLNEGNAVSPGRWYHAGIERTCSMLEQLGYRIVDQDVGTVHRDPIIHFLK